MEGIAETVQKIAAILLVAGFVAFSGCEGSETREHVDDTVKEISGKKNIDHMKQMQKNIGEIEKKQSKMYDRMDEAGDDK